MTVSMSTPALSQPAPQPSQSSAQPWLSSPVWDSILIVGPAFVSTLLAVALHPYYQNSENLPLWAWVTFVLLVDVAHVYATLFRTYLDREARQRNATLLTVIPLACWGVGCLLYSTDPLYFWRVLAYLAVFHFIRQQFGLMAVYARKDNEFLKRFAWLDQLGVYAATLYPIVYWHTHQPTNFNWFVQGDFVTNVPAWLEPAALACYATIAVAYVVKECVGVKRTGYLNVPKNLILAGTALSWWVGIVALNSDMAFTITNVVSHGVPYMALVWLYHRSAAGTTARTAAVTTAGTAAVTTAATAARTATGTPAGSATEPPASDRYGWHRYGWSRVLLAYVPAFVGFLFLLAYLEEGLWDGFVWREHLQIFPMFAGLPALHDKAVLAILIPLLSLPQSTHYVLDGFIWRVKDKTNLWSVQPENS